MTKEYRIVVALRNGKFKEEEYDLQDSAERRARYMSSKSKVGCVDVIHNPSQKLIRMYQGGLDYSPHT